MAVKIHTAIKIHRTIEQQVLEIEKLETDIRATLGKIYDALISQQTSEVEKLETDIHATLEKLYAAITELREQSLNAYSDLERFLHPKFGVTP